MPPDAEKYLSSYKNLIAQTFLKDYQNIIM